MHQINEFHLCVVGSVLNIPMKFYILFTHLLTLSPSHSKDLPTAPRPAAPSQPIPFRSPALDPCGAAQGGIGPRAAAAMVASAAAAKRR